ncbi:MAG TPA: SRPBCC family protein [Jiangellaceae bacterium]
MSTLTFQRSLIIAAPVADVWATVSDLDGYAGHTSSLAETTVTSGAGAGARRRCVDATGKAWEETCAAWSPEQEYTIEVDVSTYPAKYRALFRSFTGTWSTTPVDEGTRVTIRFEAVLRRFPGRFILARALTRRSESEIDTILNSYNDAVGAHGAREAMMPNPD